MNQHVKLLEKEGLSASIYTQPFDVEGEQNGLITYDREVVKIPFEELRKIHSMLVPNMGTIPEVQAQNADLTDPGLRYSELLGQYIDGKRDAAFLKKLSIAAMQAGDKPGVILASNAYLASLTKPYSADDLAYIMQMTAKTSDAGFTIIKENAADIDKAQGPRTAENKIMNIIYNEAIAPAVTGQQPTPDWTSLQTRVAPFGALGDEILLRAKTIHYINHPDWQQFVAAADEYVSKYGEHIRTEDLNQFAWKAFENINDKEALAKAAKWSELSVKQMQEPAYLDTYANLLYKCGRANEAIDIQQKAVTLSNGNEEMKQTLEKMKRGEPTWK
jgi:hypothetical protein